MSSKYWTTPLNMFLYWHLIKFSIFQFLSLYNLSRNYLLVIIAVLVENNVRLWDIQVYTFAIQVNLHKLLPCFKLFQNISLQRIFSLLLGRSLSSLILERITLFLAPHCCGFESWQGLWILSCDKVFQLAYGMSVVLHRCPFVPEIMHGRAPEVFLHQ
jgi:hypothetical protein